MGAHFEKTTSTKEVNFFSLLGPMAPEPAYLQISLLAVNVAGAAAGPPLLLRLLLHQRPALHVRMVRGDALLPKPGLQQATPVPRHLLVQWADAVVFFLAVADKCVVAQEE